MCSDQKRNLDLVNERVADYFVVVGLPPKLISSNHIKLSQPTSSEISTNDEQQLLYPNFENNDVTLKSRYERLDPIVDLAILNKSLNESVPLNYECIWLTKAGHSANLNHNDTIFYKSNEMFLCYRRGRDKPPITDISVLYDAKERAMCGCTVIRETIGNNSADLNNSSLSGERTFMYLLRYNYLLL